MRNLSNYFGTALPGRTGLDEKYVHRRLTSARECAEKCHSLRTLANAWGISYHGAYNFLVKYDQATLRLILENAPLTHQVHPDEGRRRIWTCYEHLRAGGSMTSAAKELGMTVSALCLWFKKNAPDGVEQAYEDYFGEEEIAA